MEAYYLSKPSFEKEGVIFYEEMWNKCIFQVFCRIVVFFSCLQTKWWKNVIFSYVFGRDCIILSWCLITSMFSNYITAFSMKAFCLSFNLIIFRRVCKPLVFMLINLLDFKSAWKWSTKLIVIEMVARLYVIFHSNFEYQDIFFLGE